MKNALIHPAENEIQVSSFHPAENEIQVSSVVLVFFIILFDIDGITPSPLALKKMAFFKMIVSERIKKDLTPNSILLFSSSKIVTADP
jgi:hypothetical protein